MNATSTASATRPIRLLGRTSSINVRKVRWACDELGVPYEQEQWGLGFKSTDTPEFRALNPNAKVPVIQDGPFVLWESNAICRYLAAREGRTDLLPAAAQERAVVEQWMDWQATELNTAWRYAFLALVRNTPAHPDPAAIAASTASWNLHMGMLEARLSTTGAYVAGAAFTVADIAVGLSTHRWLMTPIERPGYRAIAAYYERLRQQVGFKANCPTDIP